MNETKHTKGPWTVRDWEHAPGETRIGILHGHGLVAVLCDGAIVADGCGSKGGNARLIASAPELLAALRETMDELKYYHIASHGCIFPDTCSTGKAVSAARAAIRKATEGE